MGLMDDIPDMVQEILSDSDEFAIPITFTTQAGYDPATAVTCNAVAVKHSIKIDDFGAPIRGKYAQLMVSEKELNRLAYPVRNGDNVVRIKGDYISFTDSTGNTYNAIINVTYPDDTMSLIVCELGDMTV